MDARRGRFAVALAVFAAWATFLAAMATFSASRPSAPLNTPATAPKSGPG